MSAPLARVGRDNNLNLLRMIAALAVLVSHAWPITLGRSAVEPLEPILGRTLGEVAVTVFFGLSGFLVAGSWCRAPDPLRFADRRLRRILPGLWVALGLTALVMGPLVTTLGATDYFNDPGTWRFLLRNGLLMPVVPDLPEVFAELPYPAAAGSIWTLHYEMLCYGGLLIAGMAGAFASRRQSLRWLLFYLVLYTSLAAFGGADGLPARIEHLGTLSLPFVLGAAAWVWRDRIGAGHLIGLAAAGGGAAATGAPGSEAALTLAIVSAALWTAFVPAGPVRRYNRVGDYSYGVYIYAFPVQVLVQHVAGPDEPATNALLALPPTLGLAVLSWHLVERPWLARGRHRPRMVEPA